MAHAGHNLLLLFGGSSDELEASMISLCTSFYDLVLVDPVLALLFERRDVAMHARRLGLFLAMLCGGNTRYLRGGPCGGRPAPAAAVMTLELEFRR